MNALATLTNMADRYSSVLPFSTVCIHYLNQYQVSIKDIHISGCHPYELVRKSRQNVTAHFSADAKSAILAEFLKSLNPLESLNIELSGGWHQFDRHYWDTIMDPLGETRVSTKSLTLAGCMPRSFGDHFHKMFNWSMLTSLSLFDVNLWLMQDIQFDAPDIRNLVHFQCYTLDSIFEQDTVMLHEFFRLNKCLERILLSISGLVRLPIATPEQVEVDNPTTDVHFVLWPLRKRLQTVVWHSPGQKRPLDVGSLECICRNFVALQELGFTAPEALDGKTNKESMWNEDLLEYLVSCS